MTITNVEEALEYVRNGAPAELPPVEEIRELTLEEVLQVAKRRVEASILERQLLVQHLLSIKREAERVLSLLGGKA